MSSLTDQRPDPNTVSPETVAQVATERAGEQYQKVILRDAKIQEQQRYIGVLEARLDEMEQQPAQAAHRVRPAEPAPQPAQG